MGTYGSRVRLAERVAVAIDSLRTGEQVVVGFDGPDAAGKTTLADEVASLLRRPVVRVSIDGWHNPHDVRMRRGDESPEGYYLDSFDIAALLKTCLLPFRQGSRRIAATRFDCRSNEVVQRDTAVAPGAALLVDGVFLQRPELRGVWDFTVYLHVPEPVTLQRAVQRDLDQFGSEDAVRGRYTRRYLPGQALYRKLVDPAALADVLIDNSEPDAPSVLRWPDER
jgi:uridine kinase